MADGTLSASTKELIALAIAITRECDGCISAHARGAVMRGATESEVTEMIGVTISMNGGPGTVWGPRALARFRNSPIPPESPDGRRPEAPPESQRATPTGVNVQSRCLIPLMNGERRRSGSPTATISGRRSKSSRNITPISWRARWAPRQKWGPAAPNPMCGLGCGGRRRSRDPRTRPRPGWPSCTKIETLSPAFNSSPPRSHPRRACVASRSPEGPAHDLVDPGGGDAGGIGLP